MKHKAARRTLLRRAIALPALMHGDSVFGQDCSAANVKQLKKRCLSILHDMAGTLDYGLQIEQAAFAKYQDALVPALKSGKVVADLILHCFVAKNPAKCAVAAAKIPSAITNIEKSIKLAREASDLMRQSGTFIGTSKVAWDEQMGEEIVSQLAECNESNCHEIKRALILYIDDSIERVKRNKSKIDQFINELETTKEGLNKCMANENECGKLKELQPPILDKPGNRPDVPLP